MHAGSFDRFANLGLSNYEHMLLLVWTNAIRSDPYLPELRDQKTPWLTAAPPPVAPPPHRAPRWAWLQCSWDIPPILTNTL